MTSELDLLKRRIVCVISYFDEESELPWDYVERTNDGRFEAIVTGLFDGIRSAEDNMAKPISLGVFATKKEAIHAIWDHDARVRAADPISIRKVRDEDGNTKFDFNPPTVH
ncbi:MAG: hypothetical protein C5B60_04110 [Chloroflexi bacterium]|nr:MAG: hypothetical protein C5B60_04110 [Chloroflexota bacterium]